MKPEFRAPQKSGPRIYNLFPLLVGAIPSWRDHLPRIAAMGFDWIYLNPIHESGFSGSLYAIKDPYRLNERLLDSPGKSGFDALRNFISEAKDLGLRVMMDLVINHTALDALLAENHPEWYRRDAAGDFVRPQAVDPADTRVVTVWGDLAELDYTSDDARKGLIRYWARYIEHYASFGISGFRCDAAHKTAAVIWENLIDNAREANPELLFIAESLGATPAQMSALSNAGFDYFFNSSKWWDFRADWLLEQYERFRRIAPSIAFPESHDTDRLASEIADEDPERIARLLKFRYLFASSFSTGVMIPTGFEYGFRKRLNVVGTTPLDWEKPTIDLSSFIAATNAMKASLPALNQEGPLSRLTAPNAPVICLLRETMERSEASALLLINSDDRRSFTVDPGPLLFESGGRYADFVDVTPHASPVALIPGVPITLDALEMRVFAARQADTAAEPLDETASAEGIRRLAGRRVTIENISPEIDGGRHPAKRTVGDTFDVSADIFCDGHDVIRACVKYREQSERTWTTAAMAHIDNDRWAGRFPLSHNTRYFYTIEAWRDLFGSWRRDVIKKHTAGVSTATDLREGWKFVCAAAADNEALRAWLKHIDLNQSQDANREILLSEDLYALMTRIEERADCTSYDRELEVVVDRSAARCGAWYELFPRSMSDDAQRHGTFDDVIAHLPYVKSLGFDVLYLPPIHPIGTTNRKGRNNSLTAEPGDPGSPYATGAAEGGHTALHPELGDFDDFRRLVDAAHRQGIEIALDFAIQCSPDHPWIAQHPEWFDWRPDGSIKFAENPPKKYEDITHVHFYGDALPAVWLALRDVVLFWIKTGIRIFRVDNPHTKPVPFWEWMIRDVQERYPDVIFLAEAFTRPKMMHKLAKAGFTQSYTYFTWRNTKTELTAYLTELTQPPARDYFRPHFFVNTPDINPTFLHGGKPAAFRIRATLAATLSSLWGMYSGFELCEGTPLPDREEYLDSEKYQIKAWDWNRFGNIRDHISRLNRIRRENPALHETVNLRFYPAHNDQVLFYGKATASTDNVIWVAVNLDPDHSQEADIELPLHELALPDHGTLRVEDLLTGATFSWTGKYQRIALNPEWNPCAIWRVTRLDA